MQQGDPLGPLLFALSLQSLLVELATSRALGGLELVFSHLDDLCLAGDADSVASALTLLKHRCREVGLHLSTRDPTSDPNSDLPNGSRAHGYERCQQHKRG